MPTLRLFAQAREAAGTSSVELSGSTVGELLDAAVARFGDDLAGIVAESRVWCNGEPTELAAAIGEADEVAVLPPVSGGAR